MQNRIIQTIFLNLFVTVKNERNIRITNKLTNLFNMPLTKIYVGRYKYKLGLTKCLLKWS